MNAHKLSSNKKANRRQKLYYFTAFESQPPKIRIGTEHEINAMLHKPRRLKYEYCKEFVCQLMITAAEHDSSLFSLSPRDTCVLLCAAISRTKCSENIFIADIFYRDRLE